MRWKLQGDCGKYAGNDQNRNGGQRKTADAENTQKVQ